MQEHGSRTINVTLHVIVSVQQLMDYGDSGLLCCIRELAAFQQDSIP